MSHDGKRMTLEPDVRAYLEQLDLDAKPPVWEVPLETVRSNDRVLHGASPKTPVAQTKDISIPASHGTIPARVYEPQLPEGREEEMRGGVVFLHGGGFVFGDLETHDEAARRLAAGSLATVVSIDYRLAPEHRFPASVEDSVTATQWVAENAPSLGIVTDMRPSSEWASRAACAEGFGLSQATMNWFGEQYLNDLEDTEHPDASPIIVEDLRDLPPAFLLTVEFDPLRDEGNAYARRLIDAGVPTEHHELPGTIHGIMTNTARFSSGDELWRRMLAWMRATL